MSDDHSDEFDDPFATLFDDPFAEFGSEQPSAAPPPPTLTPAPVVPSRTIPALQHKPKLGDQVMDARNDSIVFRFYQEVWFGATSAIEATFPNSNWRKTIPLEHCLVVVPDETPEEEAPSHDGQSSL